MCFCLVNSDGIVAISFVTVCKLKVFVFPVTGRSNVRHHMAVFMLLEEAGPPECQLARYSAAFYVSRLYNMNIVTLCGTVQYVKTLTENILWILCRYDRK